MSKLVLIPYLLAIILISASCVATTSTITVTQTAPTVTVTVSPAITTTPIQTTTIPTGGIITIAAADLLGEFDANAIAAESKYKGQILEVTGSILEIGRNNLGVAYLRFYVDIVSLITCYSFNSNWEDQLSGISKGQEVTVRGRLDEWDGLWLSLKNCSVVQ